MTELPSCRKCGVYVSQTVSFCPTCGMIQEAGILRELSAELIRKLFNVMGDRKELTETQFRRSFNFPNKGDYPKLIEYMIVLGWIRKDQARDDTIVWARKRGVTTILRHKSSLGPYYTAELRETHLPPVSLSADADIRWFFSLLSYGYSTAPTDRVQLVRTASHQIPPGAIDKVRWALNILPSQLHRQVLILYCGLDGNRPWSMREIKAAMGSKYPTRVRELLWETRGILMQPGTRTFLFTNQIEPPTTS